MTLDQLLDGLDLPVLASQNLHKNLRGISSDSRTARSGDLFICMPSAARDTHQYLIPMAGQGIEGAFCHTAEGFSLAVSLGLASVLLPAETSQFFSAAGRTAHKMMDFPTQKMKLVGVTGTNGKTSTAWMLRDALQVIHGPTAYLGTLGLKTPAGLELVSNTTPWPVDLALMCKNAVKSECTAMTMEASSHALAEQRLAGVLFDVGVFTNLTQDHLDFHKTMDAYGEAKKLLFTQKAREAREAGKDFISVINIGDELGAKWAKDLTGQIVTYGSESAALQVSIIHATADSLHLRASWEGRFVEYSLGFGGLFHVQNSTAALGALLALGHSLDRSCEALSWASATPGRFEPVHNDLGFSVLIDYAHTPDALRTVLESVHQLPRKRIITLFGCGGDRDRTKRPLMAAAASEASDVVILTSDNPRTEDPHQIIADAQVGLTGANHQTIVDRTEAIFAAIAMAEEGDIVVLAGKGHENYQIIGREKRAYDDKEVAMRALAART